MIPPRGLPDYHFIVRWDGRNEAVKIVGQIVRPKGYFVKAAAALILLGSSAVAATPNVGPFGIPQGTSIARLNVQDRYGSKYYVVAPPVRNPNFASYTVVATPAHGVCAIIAETAGYTKADEAHAKFRDIVKLLSHYGRSNAVKPGDRWPMLQSTVKDFPVQWRGRLPNNLDSVVAETVQDGSLFKVEVSYFYRNMASCPNWEPRQDRRGL